jgi:hypothetical protein
MVHRKRGAFVDGEGLGGADGVFDLVVKSWILDSCFKERRGGMLGIL